MKEEKRIEKRNVVYNGIEGIVEYDVFDVVTGEYLYSYSRGKIEIKEEYL